jgi:hypothetical protein
MVGRDFEVLEPAAVADAARVVADRLRRDGDPVTESA